MQIEKKLMLYQRPVDSTLKTANSTLFNGLIELTVVIIVKLKHLYLFFFCSSHFILAVAYRA